MQTITLFQGMGYSWTLQAVNADGSPAINKFTGNEPLYGAVFYGDTFGELLFTFPAAWNTSNGGPLGLVDLDFSAANTTGVWPGTYKAIVALADFSEPLVSATLVIAPSPVGTPTLDGAFTRATADLGLLKRVGAPLARVAISLDPSTPISQFDDPLVRALMFLKITPANILSPSDDDIAHVLPKQWIELLDIAEAETLTWATTAHTFTAANYSDERWPDYSYRRDPIGTQWLQKMADTKMARCRKLYGYDTATLKYGTINLGFQANRQRYSQIIGQGGEIA